MFGSRRGRSRVDEARDILASVVLSHVPVPQYDFQQKVCTGLLLCQAQLPAFAGPCASAPEPGRGHDEESVAAAAQIIYLAVMGRRMLGAMLDPSLIDDRDYYGNKRLELAGGLLALLFEDLFKRMNAELKRTVRLTDAPPTLAPDEGGACNAACTSQPLCCQCTKTGVRICRLQCDNVLSKANRPRDYDATKSVRGEMITQGMESAISSGNWTIRRFRMERKGVTQVPVLCHHTAALPGAALPKLCAHAGVQPSVGDHLALTCASLCTHDVMLSHRFFPGCRSLPLWA
jgi:DNA-directed RNA polymerase III subunit RPC2